MKSFSIQNAIFLQSDQKDGERQECSSLPALTCYKIYFKGWIWNKNNAEDGNKK